MSDKLSNRQAGRKCLGDISKEKAASLSAIEYVKNGRQGDYLACDASGKPKVVCGAYRGRYNEDGSISQRLELRKDNKTNTITTVQKDNVLTKDEVYWRKLTPIECERLQTVPDNYTNHVSNTQRYKMLGNGWTIEVIAHILKGMEI